MLRITNIAEENGSRLKLEGTLSGAWVEELRRLCEAVLIDGGELTLDCSSVSFADPQGIAFMQALRESNVPLLNCSPFLRWQLGEASITRDGRGEK